jgi:hypothetical protein
MNSKRLYYVLISLIVVLGASIIAVSYKADEMFKKQSESLLDQKAISQALSTKQQQLIKDKRDIKAYTELNAVAKAIVPQDKDQALTIREISNLAKQSGIYRLSSVTFPASNLGISVTPTSGTSRTSTTTPKAANSNLTQLTPVKGIPGVYNLQITVQQVEKDAVSYSTFISFLERLEQNRRTAQVSNISVIPSKKNPDLVSFTLIIDEYIKP